MATLAQKLAKQPASYVRVEQTLALPVTAVADTDFVMTIPAAAIDVSYLSYTVTAYGAATDAQLKVGSTVGGVDYVAAVSIKAVARAGLTPVGAAAATHYAIGGTTLYVRVTQSGTASATGLGYLVVQYAMPV